jgi:hypothetical protein
MKEERNRGVMKRSKTRQRASIDSKMPVIQHLTRAD